MSFKLGEILQQAQKMQEEMNRLQQAVAEKTVEATAGGGMVKVIASGKMDIISIEIDPQILQMNDKAMLQDLVKAGVNEALASAKQLLSQEMNKMVGLGPLAQLLKGFGST